MPNLEKARLLLNDVIAAQERLDRDEKERAKAARKIPPVGDSFILEHLRNLRELLNPEDIEEPKFPQNQILAEGGSYQECCSDLGCVCR